MVTPRENLIRAARRRNPEWIPMDFGVSKGAMAMFRKHLGADVNVPLYFKYDGRWIGPSGGTRCATQDWRKLYYSDGSLPVEAWINAEWGTATLEHPATDDAVSFCPLRNISSEADLDAYPWPDDVGAAHRFSGIKEKVDAAHAEGMPVYGSGLNFFEQLWGLCGFDTLMMWMALDESWAWKMFRKHAEDLMNTAEQIASTGADILHAVCVKAQ